MEHPYPEILQLELGLQVVNFGLPNAGVDAFVHDHGLLTIGNNAKVVVLQVPGAQNMSNRFYAVHPRRNDRFLRASNLLKSLYEDVDFTEFNFTRHMLAALYEVSPDRFALVVKELQTAWVARMKLLLSRLDCEVILLWLSDHPIQTTCPAGIMGSDPLFVHQDMMQDIAEYTRDVVEVVVGPDEIKSGRNGLVFADVEEPATHEMLGVVAHQKTSRALRSAVERIV